MPSNRKEKCDRCNKVKADELCGDDRLCRSCEVQNAAALAKLNAERDARSNQSNTTDFIDQTSSDFHGDYNMLQRQMHELLDAYHKLAAEVGELKRLLSLNPPSSDTDKLAAEVAEVKASLQTVSVSNSKLKPKTVCTDGPDVLVSVHAELADAKRRKRNVIVHGLQPSDDISDCELFDTLCEENLSVKPALVRDQCKRIGKKGTGKPQLFLAVLRNDEAASELLRSASQLRNSFDADIQRHVFINPDLTRAEAQLAFQRREARRQRRLRSTAPRPQDSHGSPSAHRVMLSADANAFVPLGASSSSPPVQRDVNSI